MLDGGAGQTMSFAHTSGQVGHHRDIKGSQSFGNDGGPGYPVHIEVAEYPHRFLAADGLVQPSYGPIHAGQAQRVMGQPMGRLKEKLQLLPAVDAPAEQHLDRCRRQVDRQPVALHRKRELPPFGGYGHRGKLSLPGPGW